MYVSQYNAYLIHIYTHIYSVCVRQDASMTSYKLMILVVSIGYTKKIAPVYKMTYLHAYNILYVYNGNLLTKQFCTRRISHAVICDVHICNANTHVIDIRDIVGQHILPAK